MIPLLPLGLLYVGYELLIKESPAPARAAVQGPALPTLSLEEIARRATLLRTLPTGGVARYIHPTTVNALLQRLGSVGIEKVEAQPGGVQPFGPVFRLVQAYPGSPTAAQAVQKATEDGLVSVCSLSTLGNTNASKFLMLIKPSDRAKISSAGQWAIVWDGTPAVSPPRPTEAKNPFASLPKELADEAATFISDKNGDACNALAKDLRRFGHTEAANQLEARAKTFATVVPEAVDVDSAVDELLNSSEGNLNGQHSVSKKKKKSDVPPATPEA